MRDVQVEVECSNPECNRKVTVGHWKTEEIASALDNCSYAELVEVLTYLQEARFQATFRTGCISLSNV